MWGGASAILVALPAARSSVCAAARSHGVRRGRRDVGRLRHGEALRVLAEGRGRHGGADGAARELCATALAEMTPNVVTLLQGLLAFSGPQFGKHLPAFYPLLADLIHCESPQIAAVLRELFAQRVAPHLQAEAS